MTDTSSGELVERRTASGLGWRQRAHRYLQSFREYRKEQVRLAKERNECRAITRHARTLDQARGRVGRFWRHSI